MTEPRRSKFRLVETRIHHDRKFRALSGPRANAQDLWLYLLTAPESTCVPGLIAVSLATVSSLKGWSLRATRRAFAELETQNMARGDDKAPLIWLPKVAERNRPRSPSNVKPWSAVVAEMPECDLLDDAVRHLRLFLAGLGDAYLAEFEGHPKPHPKGDPKPDPSGEKSPDRRKTETETEDGEAVPVCTPAQLWTQVRADLAAYGPPDDGPRWPISPPGGFEQIVMQLRVKPAEIAPAMRRFVERGQDAKWGWSTLTFNPKVWRRCWSNSGSDSANDDPFGMETVQ